MSWAIEWSRKSQSSFDSKIFKNHSALAGVVQMLEKLKPYIKRDPLLYSWVLIRFVCLLCSHT